MTKTWQQNKPRVTSWVVAERQRMVEGLGGKCEWCGSTENLQFHHTKPRTWVASQLNRWQRLAEYKREIARGEIVLLCKSCNCRAGKPVPCPEPDPDFTPDF